VAILLNEPDGMEFLERLQRLGPTAISAANRAEFLLVANTRLRGDGAAMARDLLERLEIVTLPVDESLADLAVQAHRKFGKGRHPAGLNFGDCFSYALARRIDVPLLFKGDDFSQTDLRIA
jgi:ribonuclease VapC